MASICGPQQHTDPSDGLLALFEPDVLLPAQVGARRQTAVTIAERRLLATLLADAIGCFRKYRRPRNRKQRRLFREAEAWIMDDDQAPMADPHGSPCSFSFQYVCDVLGLDVGDVRAALRRWQETPRQGG